MCLLHYEEINLCFNVSAELLAQESIWTRFFIIFAIDNADNMERIDIAKLRKEAGISQRELADKLQIRPSFLSAIENGRSRLPEAQLEKIKQIFGISDFSEYLAEEQPKEVPANTNVPPHSHFGEEGNAIALFLQHIHNQAHQESGHSNREEILEQRVDYLSERNDRLSSRVDELRDQLDVMRDENYRLKLLLASNGISIE